MLRLVWLLLYPHRHRSILGAAGHIILTPANQLMKEYSEPPEQSCLLRWTEKIASLCFGPSGDRTPCLLIRSQTLIDCATDPWTCWEKISNKHLSCVMAIIFRFIQNIHQIIPWTINCRHMYRLSFVLQVPIQGIMYRELYGNVTHLTLSLSLTYPLLKPACTASQRGKKEHQFYHIRKTPLELTKNVERYVKRQWRGQTNPVHQSLPGFEKLSVKISGAVSRSRG
jgi:hypothetical protein